MADLYYNRVKHILKNKGKVSAAWLHGASNVSAEILAQAGFDVLVIDEEHSPVDYQTLLSMCQAIKAAGATPFARVPWNDLIAIKRTYDCGVMGISVPYVRNAEEAREAVYRSKYPPFGIRGIAGSPRACGYGLNVGEYMQRANDENLIMIAIETLDGIDNLPEIMEIEELDGIFIGPMDLSTSMGIRGQYNNPDFQAAIKRIEDIVLPSNKFLATVANDVEDAQKKYDKGYNFIIMMSDTVDLAKMAMKTVARFKELNPEVEAE